MKKFIIGLLVIMLVLTGCNKKEDKKNKNVVEENPTEINTTVNYQKEQTIDNLLFYDVSLVKVGADSLFEVHIKNVGESDYAINKVNITLKDKDGNIVQMLEGLLVTNIGRDKEKVISAYYSGSIDNVDSVTYEIVK